MKKKIRNRISTVEEMEASREALKAAANRREPEEDYEYFGSSGRSDESSEGRGLRIAANRQKTEREQWEAQGGKYIPMSDTDALKAAGCEQRKVKEAAYQTYDFEDTWDCPTITVNRWFGPDGKQLETDEYGLFYKVMPRKSDSKFSGCNLSRFMMY
jgi:hypothetical protein